MKLQAITLLAAFSALLASSSADAGKFNLGDALKVAQQINNGPKIGGGNPGFIGGNPGFVQPLPHPTPGPGFGGGITCKPKPPVFCPPPVVKPCPPPVFCPPPVVKPCPPPVYCPPPVISPCPPPVCPPPVCHPPVCPPPVCHPPVNQPPVKCFTMKLMNNAGAEVYFNLDKAAEYSQMPVDDVQLIKSHSPQSHLISYHNGQQVVEYELDPSASYSFEWQGETLMLLQIQG